MMLMVMMTILLIMMTMMFHANILGLSPHLCFPDPFRIIELVDDEF